MADDVTRRLPVGAEVIPGRGTHFRVWAPQCKAVAAAVRTAPGTFVDFALTREAHGYFSGFVPTAGHGTLYRYRLDGAPEAYPDPASRYQPDGPHGDSCVIDPTTFDWTDGGWKGCELRGQVVYELHVGTFTQEGTFAAARRELGELAALGVGIIEVMPVGDFPGTFGWGYDGVNIFAPTRLYGEPDDFRRFVDDAHALGMGVILDVIYNHLGPDGNYLRLFSREYFTNRYVNEWGDAINFDGAGAGPVREYFVSNARYWVEEFHLDGMRLDATQQVFDGSPRHILADVIAAARGAAGERALVFVAENEPQDVRLVAPQTEEGFGADALWNDDFHHTAVVAMTGHNEAYYTDYFGAPQEFISALKYGYLYQGQWYSWQKQRRGTPSLDLPPCRFILYIQNHDQIANSASGYRCHQIASPGVYRALTALLLLAPGSPMLFQGQEFGASTPFFYFADHTTELARKVGRGRKKFLAQFRSLASVKMQRFLPDPKSHDTFLRSKLDLTERETHPQDYALHLDLIRMRREDPVFSRCCDLPLDGAVLSSQSFVLRYFSPEGDRLVLVNLGRDQRLSPVPEPLVAPPRGASWELLWSSEDPRYGGQGVAALTFNDNFWLPGQATIVLAAHRVSGESQWKK